MDPNSLQNPASAGPVTGASGSVSPLTPSPQSPRSKKWLWAAIIVAVLLILGGGVWVAVKFIGHGNNQAKATPTPQPGLNKTETTALGDKQAGSNTILQVTQVIADQGNIATLVARALQVTADTQLGGNLTVTGNGTFGGTVRATNFIGSGAGLTGVNADLLNGQPGSFYTDANNLQGTIGDARLSANVALRNAPNTFSAGNTFNGGLAANSVATGTLTVSGSASLSGTTTISSLILSTPLSVSNGGTGLATIPVNGVVFGQGAASIGTAVPSSAGQCLLSTLTSVQFGSCPGGGGSGVNSINTLSGDPVIANASVAGSTITIDNATTSGTKGIASFNATNFSVVAGVVNTSQNLAVGSTPTFAGLSLSAPLAVGSGGTGASTLAANGVVIGQGTGAVSVATSASPGECLISTAGAPTFQTCPGSGGVVSVNSQTGIINVANASASANTITIDNATTIGAKGIASFNATNFSVVAGVVNTIQNINSTAAPTFGQLTLSSSQASANMLTINNTNVGGTGKLLDLQLNGTSQLTVGATGDLSTLGTITSGLVNGQTISSSASFTGSLAVGTTLAVNTITPSAALTVGATNRSFLIQGNNASTITSTAGANTTTLAFQSPTANVTYTIPTAPAGSYDICTTVGNCAGTGSGVTTTGGTPGTIPKFTASQAVGDSIISDSGTVVTIAGGLSVNTITPSAAATVGATAQNLTLQGATVNLKSTSGGITNSLTFATPSGSNKTITVPNASGTVAVSASGPLSLDAAGNLTCSTCLTSGGGGAGGVSDINTVTGSVTLQGSSAGSVTVAGSTITIVDASSSTKGLASFDATNFTVTSGAVNTVQSIAVGATPTFAGLNLTAALTVGNGGTGATSASGARTSLGAAASGANADITSLSGLTTALSVAQGGTGVATTPTNGQILIGNGTGFSLNTLTAGSGVSITNGSGTITISAPGVGSCAGCADQALSNLSGVAINTSLLPASAASASLGSSTLPFGQLALAGTSLTPATNNFLITGASTSGTRTITLPDASGTVAVSASGYINLSAVGNLTFTGTLAVADGGTGATSASGARSNLGAAASGSNSDISSLTGLTTALSVDQGGTGANTLAANGVLIGNGTSAITSVTGSNTECLVIVGGTPIFQTCPGTGGVTSVNSGTGAITIQGNSGTSITTVGSTITINDASAAVKGLASFNSGNFSVASGAVNTVQNIDMTATPTFGQLTLTGTGSLTLGTTGAGNAGSVKFYDGTSAFAATLNTTTLTANRTISLPNEAGTICLQSSSSCGFLTTAAANAAYIQLQGSTPGTAQTGNLNISGTGIFGTSVLTPTIDIPTAGALSVGSATATSINLGNITNNIATTINGTALVKPTATHDSATAFQVQTAAAAQVLTVDTINQQTILTAAGTDATLGAALVDTAVGTNDFPTGWGAPANWTLSANSAVHASGSTTALTSTTAAVIGTTYQVKYTYSACTAANTLGVTMGGVTLETTTSCVGSNTKVFTATSTAGLSFTPGSTYAGTVSSVKIQVLSTVAPVLTVKNSSATATLEVRSSGTANNTLIGLNAGKSNTSTATNVTALGANALQSNTTGISNTAIGSNALQSNTSGQQNTALGYQSLASNTLGGQNIALGGQALFANTIGSFNTAVGVGVMLANTSGTQNTALGNSAISSNTTGSSNTGLGYQVLGQNTTGAGNTAAGDSAVAANTTGSNNTGIGRNSLGANTTGSNNTALGYRAGTSDSGGSFVTGAALQNTTAIGAFSQVQASNAIVLGSVDTATKVGIGTTIPSNTFSVSPLDTQSSTATRTNSSATLVASSGVWSAANVGDIIIFADGTTNTVSAFIDSTHITMGTTYAGVTDASPVSYRFHKIGFQVANTGNVGIGTNPTTDALAVQGTVTATAFTQNGNAVCDASNNCSSLTATTGVQLQASTPGTPQTGNLNITGTGIIPTIKSSSIDTASAGTLSIGGTTANGVSIGKSTGSNSITGVTTFNGAVGSAFSYHLYSNSTSTSAVTTDQIGLFVEDINNSTAVSVTNLVGIRSAGILNNTSTNVTNYFGIESYLRVANIYSGTLTNGAAIQASAPTFGGAGKYFSSYSQFNAAAFSSNGSNTTGTVNNYGLQVGAMTSAAGSGGTLNNYAANLTVPSGAGGTATNNYGLYIQGNGGGTLAYSIYSSSTAASFFAGNITSSGTIAANTFTQNGNTVCDSSSNCSNYLTSSTGVQLQGSTPGTAQTGNLNVTGIGIFGTAAKTASLRPVTDSTTALLIQNAAGSTTIATVDSTNSQLIIGASGNTITLSPTTGFTAAGTARKTKLVSLNAEYPASVLDATNDASCSSANNGTMTSAYYNSGSTNINYYQWATSQVTAQCYDVVAQITIPMDFSAWASSTPFTLQSNTTNTTNGTIKAYITDTAGTNESSYNYVSMTPGSASTWTTVTGAGALAGTYTPGSTMTVRIRLTGTSTATVQLGSLNLSYLSKF